MDMSLDPKENTVETLLLGGGYSLAHLATRLPARSFVITSRKEEQVSDWKSKKSYYARRADLHDMDSLRQLFQEFKHLKTVIDSVPPPPVSNQELLAIYKPYLELLEHSDVTRAFFLSSTGVYGQADGEWVDESSSTIPISESGKRRLYCEELYRASSLQTTCFRLSGIYGPGRGLRPRLEQGNYRLVEGHDNWSNRIHVEDIAGVLMAALEHGAELPEVINLTDDEPALMSEVVEFYCENWGLELPQKISRQEAESEGRFRFLASKRVSNALLHDVLDYRFQFPNYRSMA